MTYVAQNALARERHLGAPVVPDVDVEGGAFELHVHEGTIGDHRRKEVRKFVLDVRKTQRRHHDEVEAVGGGDDVDERKHDVEDEEDAQRTEANAHGMRGAIQAYARRETSSSKTRGR